jgi:hypothetical protein
MSSIAPLPSDEFTNKNIAMPANECNPTCNPATVWMWVIAVVAFFVIIVLLFFGSHTDELHEFTNREGMDNMRYADCPKGYILSGDQCIPDSDGNIRQTCPDGGTPLNEGVCRIRKKATCPDGYDNIGGVNCQNLSNKHMLPISEATCAAGETKEGGFCVKKYAGTCPSYYVNSGTGVNACTHEFPSMSPTCNTGETLKDGRCYTGSVETFARANEIEAKAIASLNI